MSIILVGGHERMAETYKRKAKARGHKLKVMSKMKTEFTKRIGSPDGIIIFTDTVSHKMVIAAERMAKKKDVPVVKCHTSSQVALESTLDELDEIVYSLV